MKAVDYVEYIGTKKNGEIVESQASQMVLPPESDKYQVIKSITHYTDGSQYTYIAKDDRSDTDKLTEKLINAGADRAQVIAIVDGYGDAVDWSYHSLDSIIGEVWGSDLNSGDDPENWIINEICRTFNISEVTA